MDLNFNLSELDKLSDKEKEYALSILKELSESGKSKKYDDLLYADYDEIPVDITTFLHDKKYLGGSLYDAEGRFTLFPYWEEKLKEIFPTNIDIACNTLILTGSIGIGKSTIAVICLLYILYRLMCLHDPYLHYGLQPSDKISISLMNITIENAKGVALDKMNEMLLASPWFMSHGEMRGKTNLVYENSKRIYFITASSNNQIIGRCLFANFSDEVNWGITNDTEKLKKKYKQLVSQIDSRMKSRFLRGERLPTLNIIASSKNSEQSFLEDYIETKKKNESKTTIIVDEKQWVVDPRKDTPEKFYVAVGNKFLANELLPRGCSKTLVEEYRAKGYSILEVPTGYYDTFQDNIDLALIDIAGIATASSMKFISGMRWNDIKTSAYKNPFVQEVITVGNAKDDTAQYSDFFDLSRVTPEMKGRPLFIHLDLSKSGDKTGIGGVYIMGKKPSNEGGDPSRDLYYRVAFGVSVQAPKGYEISFDKSRTFIRWLREQGFSIKGISCDSYGSSQLQQQLSSDGFNVCTLSVDRLDTESKQCLPYAYLKSTMYERRLEVYDDCPFLTEEVLGLERETDGHINHPENGTAGSKDQIDSITGATYNASSHAEEFAFDYGEFLDVIDESNKSNFYDTARKQISVDFEEALNQMHDPLRLTNKDKDNGNKTPGLNPPTNASFNEDVYASLGIFVI